jgi:hypothetical protein
LTSFRATNRATMEIKNGGGAEDRSNRHGGSIVRRGGLGGLERRIRGALSTRSRPRRRRPRCAEAARMPSARAGDDAALLRARTREATQNGHTWASVVVRLLIAAVPGDPLNAPTLWPAWQAPPARPHPDRRRRRHRPRPGLVAVPPAPPDPRPDQPLPPTRRPPTCGTANVVHGGAEEVPECSSHVPRPCRTWRCG